MALLPCADLSAATWITASDQPWDELVGFGPAGFPAYARLRFIPDPAHEGQNENDFEMDDADSPSETARLRTVLETLTRHTRTPDDLYFCLWDGWSSDIWSDHDDDHDAPQRRPRMAPAFPASVLDGPRVVVPARAYFLFRGAVSDFGDWGAADMWPGQPRVGMPDPAFIWPADQAWCIANDVDPHWAGIGADVSAIAELLADSRIDVVTADPRKEQPWYR